MFFIDQYALVAPKMEELIIAERSSHTEVAEVIEASLSDTSKGEQSSGERDSHHPLIIGGQTGVRLMLGDARTMNDFEFKLYSGDALWWAVELANRLWVRLKDKPPHDRIISMRTVEYGEQFTIFVNTRSVLSIRRLRQAELLKPTLVPFFRGKKSFDVLVIPPEMQLISIYRTLTSPHLAKEWESTLEIETKLFKWMLNRISIMRGAGTHTDILDIIESRSVSDLRSVSDSGCTCDVCITDKVRGGSVGTRVDTRKVRGRIIKLLKSEPGRLVLVGEYAALLTIGASEDWNNPLHLISSNTDADIAWLSSSVGDLSHNFRSMVDTIGDPQLGRISLKVRGESHDVAYIYNTGMYDLVPFRNIKGMQVGNAYTIIRFLLVDMWIVRILRQVGSVNEKWAEQRVGTQLSLIGKVWRTITPENQFEHEESNYFGYFMGDQIASSMKVLAKTKTSYGPSEYKPEEYEKINGKLRSIDLKQKNEAGIKAH